LTEYALFNSNSDSKTHRVGTKKPNRWGLYDMHGNVWEWVEDDWHKDYNGAPDDGSAWIDKPRGAVRVMRGGCWGCDAPLCRSAGRDSDWLGRRLSDFGFRLSRSVALGP
jgi:formylglycine-generating enzyme required for sulfatase activity